MKKQFPIVIACFISLLVISCKKESNDPPAKTKTELITQASWKFSTATSGGTDISAFIATCQKDNILTFSASLNGIADEGATKCNAGDPQTNPFTWSFGAGETILNVSSTFFSGGSNVFTIVSLTATELILSQTITVSGTPQNVIVRFVH